MRPFSVLIISAGLIAADFAVSGKSAIAQGPVIDRYFPLDHRIPGRATQWNRAIRPHLQEYVQQVRIELPSIGLVTFYDGSSDRNILTQAPSQAGILVGRTYRFQISGMPEYPGANLYPTVELLDRLHPPSGREQEFPIPIQFTEEEIETALDDRLVTKVIYLEQPQWAVPQEPGRPMHVADLEPSTNLLQAADRRGRAMAIVRLGGRTPNTQNSNNSFYGDLAPVITQQTKTPSATATTTRRTAPANAGTRQTESDSAALVSIRD